MTSFDPFAELTVDESEDLSRVEIDDEYDTLILSNPRGRNVTADRLAEHLERLPGIDRVTSLQVEPDSRVTDLRFIRAMPNLRSLMLYGLRLRTLDGIEHFREGQFIDVDTGTNRERSIDRIGEAPITRLLLHWANPRDLHAIGRSSTLRTLEMTACRVFATAVLHDVPLEELTLESAAIEEFHESRAIPTLDDVILRDCRRLERLTGDNGGVTRLIVESCDRLDFRTVKSFASLRYLTIVGGRQELRLGWLAGLAHLEELSLQDVKTVADVDDLRDAFPRLEELWVSRLEDDRVVKLSRQSRGVVVSNDEVSYRDGARIDGSA